MGWSIGESSIGEPQGEAFNSVTPTATWNVILTPPPYRFSTSRPAKYLWMTLDNSV